MKCSCPADDDGFVHAFSQAENLKIEQKMKRTPFILSIAALGAVVALSVASCTGKGAGTGNNKENDTTAVSAKPGSIVYFNLDKVLNDYDMANDLRSVVEAKVQGMSDEVNRRGTKLQNDVNDFQNKLNKGLLTRTVAETQGQKLEQRRNEFNEFANQKNQEAAEEQQVMLNNILDAIKQFIDSYTKENSYAMVLATQGDILPMPVVAADSSLDVTADVIAKLNSEYVKNKAKGTDKKSED